MITNTRRAFLGGMGSGVLAVGLGGTLLGRPGLALGLAGPVRPNRGDDLDFGELEPLAAAIQETPPEKLQLLLVQKLRDGLELSTLVAATSLANARSFGGHDYIGYHCQMALIPALEMARLLPAKEAPLPVLKVVYRTASRIQEHGGRASESLHRVTAEGQLDRKAAAAMLHDAYLRRDLEDAEVALAQLARGAGTAAAYDALLPLVQENLDVHRIVLAWRAFEVIPLTGDRHAETLLRQSLRFCIDAEKRRVRQGHPEPELRALLPSLLDRCGLQEGSQEARSGSNEEIEKLALAVFCCDKRDAAGAVAEALGEGALPGRRGRGHLARRQPHPDARPGPQRAGRPSGQARRQRARRLLRRARVGRGPRLAQDRPRDRAARPRRPPA